MLTSKTKLKVIRFLLEHEAEMSEREIASLVRVSHMSVNRTVRELADINFVHCVTIGKAHVWRVNRKSYAYQLLSTVIKGVREVKEPMESLKETILRNLPKEVIERIVLFGSVAKGSEEVESDIDLFILVRDRQGKVKVESSLDRLAGLCLDKYGNRLAAYVLTEFEMNQKKNLGVVTEIKKGLQVFPKR
jgi:predicted nucleotidyltransferase